MIEERTFVYAIGSEDGPVKVGITQSLGSRLRALQNGSACKLELIWVYTTWDREEALQMERQFHTVNKDARLEGEWFQLTATFAFQSLECQVQHNFDQSIKCFMTGEAICARHLRSCSSSV